MSLSARDLINLSEDQIWELKDKTFDLRFDDKTIETNSRRCHISWYFYEFHRRYPKTPVNSHVHLDKNALGKDDELNFIANAMRDTYYAYNGTVDVEELARVATQIVNAIYNASFRLGAYVATVTAISFAEVVRHPRIMEIINSVKNNYGSVAKAQRDVLATILDPAFLPNNQISVVSKCKLHSLGQVQFCVGILGYRSDLSGDIFPNAILTNFTNGLYKFHDSFIESRSMTRAITYAGPPLQDAEYTRRQFQLLSGTFTEVTNHDCKTTDGTNWTLDKKDLTLMQGKYFIDEKGQNQAILPHRMDLIGKTVKLRTLRHCRETKPQARCHYCYGMIHTQIPHRTNIGFIGSTENAKNNSQKILGVKHEDGSAVINNIIFTEHERRYVNNTFGDDSIYLAERMKGRKRVTMTVSAKECKGILDIRNASDITSLQIFSMTELTVAKFDIVKVSGELESSQISVAFGEMKPALSQEMLQYMKEHGWSINDRGDYVVDLHSWDYALPAMRLPMKHHDVLDYVSSIKSKYIGEVDKPRGQRDKWSISAYDDYDEALRSLYGLITSQANVNIVHIETMVYSMCVKDAAGLDYRLPTYGDNYNIGSFLNIMANRSISAVMTFQGQATVLHSPQSYLVKYRPDHFLDDIIIAK